MPEAEPRSYHHGNLRTALLDAAERGLREHGADQLSLRDLAREIGVSHAAPRRHFADRQTLLDTLAENGFLRLADILGSALAEAADEFPARVRAGVTAYAHFATDNAALLELMYTSKHRRDAPRIAEAAGRVFGLLIGLIEQGQADGALAPGDPEQIGLVLYATVHGLTTMINGDMIAGELLDELVETAVAQFLRGARPLSPP
ncbi:TetR/AcrR family transcriptional regulator [Sciscionella sediminilitoris]|uniref:TetR/AcrR family transcriptional regulator n=1 Tax=Sciscionella sediminilitoris TaxID=1445613 RepID=UPI00056824AF|nr:TetR/AcrR family transcriptional regulator [Sciscionella sp. SE31]